MDVAFPSPRPDFIPLNVIPLGGRRGRRAADLSPRLIFVFLGVVFVSLLLLVLALVAEAAETVSLASAPAVGVIVVGRVEAAETVDADVSAWCSGRRGRRCGEYSCCCCWLAML